MAGVNRFRRRVLFEDVRSARPTGDRPCVFISHKTEDKHAARILASYVKGADLDVWFDERDEELQSATQVGDDEAITQAIERGLRSSTHALCLLTPSTVKSWWVPYELGFAAHGEAVIASVRHQRTQDVPSFLKIKPILVTKSQLDDWLRKQGGTPKFEPSSVPGIVDVVRSL